MSTKGLYMSDTDRSSCAGYFVCVCLSLSVCVCVCVCVSSLSLSLSLCVGRDRFICMCRVVVRRRSTVSTESVTFLLINN